MTLAGLVERLNLKVFAGKETLSREVKGGYAGDLLSDVMAHSRKDDVWVTIQVHPNIIAVAVLKELAAIVVANGRAPAAETVEQAERETVTVLGTQMNVFEFVGRLHELGIKGA